jgi:hypothetical protein
MRIPLLVLAWLLIAAPGAGAAEKAPRGSFPNAACVTCHTPRQPQLVADWRASGHARKTPKADCVACHGNTHSGSLQRARRDSACTGCHEKLKRAVVHSYATSKHGVITQLEGDRRSWVQPLTQGNYRTPGCAYCHLHRAEHNVNRGVTPWNAFAEPSEAVAEAARSAMQPACGECHAPRYVAEQADSGGRMAGIARMKLREARDLIERQRGSATQAELADLERQLTAMSEHGRNVRIGVGHQSPDYQWWHGHPALDGDLLRIKGRVSEIERKRALEAEERYKVQDTSSANGS